MQLMNYFHESVFNPFPIKVCERNSEKPVGHFPREISRVTKFIIEPGATVDVELTSDHYRRSPLVQGGLEIKCEVTVKVSNATPKKVNERYRALVESSMLSLRQKKFLVRSFSIHQRSKRPRRQPNKPNESTTKSKDIRTFFNKERNVVTHACTKKQMIVID